MSAPSHSTPIARVILAKGREKALRQGHPWLFSGAVSKQEGAPEAPLAHVFSAKGECLGVGWYNPRSQIRVRLLSHGPTPPPIDHAFFTARLAEAETLRRAVVPTDTTGYRLVNAEGDGLPGWTVDRFDDVLVSQITTVGLERLREDAFASLANRYPDMAILARNHAPARRQERLDQTDRWHRGEPRTEAPFVENGLQLTAELDGQKTGSYLDQRDNRLLAEQLASGRHLLDLFAHAGAFSLFGLRGGAAAVTAIESAERMAGRATRHLEANPALDATRLDWRTANVFEALRTDQDTYDLVICDPPSLVKRRQDRDAGARAYKDLNRLALRRIAPGGLLMTFTCSGGVDAKLFRQILFAAATEAGVRVAMLRPLAAAPDHPVAITHPQGEYLNGWLLAVQGPR